MRMFAESGIVARKSTVTRFPHDDESATAFHEAVKTGPRVIQLAATLTPLKMIQYANQSFIQLVILVS